MRITDKHERSPAFSIKDEGMIGRHSQFTATIHTVSSTPFLELRLIGEDKLDVIMKMRSQLARFDNSQYGNAYNFE